MTGISIIKGKPVIQANLMAAAVRAHPRYDYKVIRLDDEACELAFYRDGKDIGHSKFDRQDAIDGEVGKLVAPGASGSMMKRFPRNMLFARAMSNGVKWYCPDAFTGAAVYTPGELDNGDVVEAEITEITETQPAPKELTDIERGAEITGEMPRKHPRKTVAANGNGKAEDEGPFTFDGFVPDASAFEDAGAVIFPSGKHREECVKDVDEADRGYIAWQSENPEPKVEAWQAAWNACRYYRAYRKWQEAQEDAA